MRRSRKSPQGADGQIRLGDVVVDLAAIQIIRIPGPTGGPSDITEIRLTPTEWRLLAELLNHPGSRSHRAP
jgi:two-component system, OmpR family, KDP operon response regulator KdpE